MTKRRTPASGEAEGYTLRPEQGAMLGLPTKPPEQLPADAGVLRQLVEGALPAETRLQRVVRRYRAPSVPDGQLGLGTSFGASGGASQMGLFDPRKR
jgi:hypothetical protein